MTEERPLTALLTPKVDTDNLGEFKSGLADAFTEALSDTEVASSLNLDLSFSEDAVRHLEEVTVHMESVFAGLNEKLSELSKAAASLHSALPDYQSAVAAASQTQTPTDSTSTNAILMNIQDSVTTITDRVDPSVALAYMMPYQATLTSSISTVTSSTERTREVVESIENITGSFAQSTTETTSALADRLRSMEEQVKGITNASAASYRDSLLSDIHLALLSIDKYTGDVAKNDEENKRALTTLQESVKDYASRVELPEVTTILTSISSQIDQIMDPKGSQTEDPAVAATNRVESTMSGVQLTLHQINESMRDMRSAYSSSSESEQELVESVFADLQNQIKLMGNMLSEKDQAPILRGIEEALDQLANKESMSPDEFAAHVGNMTKTVQYLANQSAARTAKTTGFIETATDKLGQMSRGIGGEAGKTSYAFFSGINSAVKKMAESKRFADEGDNTKAALAKLSSIEAIGNTAFNTVINIGKTFMEMFEKLWKMIVDSSPMLKSILGLFDTAISLIFMPIGNKIAEMLIPGIINIMESIQDVWDMMDEAYEQDGLGGMIEVAVNFALEIFFEKVEMLIGVLQNSNTGWLKNIGDILAILEKWVKDGIFVALGTMIETTKFIFEHFKEFVATFVGAYVGFKVFLTTQHARIMTGIQSIKTVLNLKFNDLKQNMVNTLARVMVVMKTEHNKDRLAKRAAAIAEAYGKAQQTTVLSSAMAVASNPLSGMAAAAIGAVGSMLITEAVMSMLGMKDGGKVPATPGGELHILGEGGEPEYVVPESKAEKFAEDYGKTLDSDGSSKGNTYNIVINGYTDSELKSYVTDIINDAASMSRIRAGF